MTAAAIYEIVGYVGSVLIVLSLTRKSILKLRLFGLAGAVVFLVYSVLIGAIPLALVNVVIIVIHVIFLREMFNKKDYFRVLRVQKDSRYLQYFLEFYHEDIRRFQPHFTYQPSDQQVIAFILRDLMPAGLFVGELDDDGCLHVTLDYVIPQYRDFKAGSYLYSPQSGLIADLPCNRAWSEPGSPVHTKYLEKMGFVPGFNDNGESVYVMDVPPSISSTRELAFSDDEPFAG